jgi:hypothetical protein
MTLSIISALELFLQALVNVVNSQMVQLLAALLLVLLLYNAALVELKFLYVTTPETAHVRLTLVEMEEQLYVQLDTAEKLNTLAKPLQVISHENCISH